jgi:hypothetical protein
MACFELTRLTSFLTRLVVARLGGGSRIRTKNMLKIVLFDFYQIQQKFEPMTRSKYALLNIAILGDTVGLTTLLLDRDSNRLGHELNTYYSFPQNTSSSSWFSENNQTFTIFPSVTS